MQKNITLKWGNVFTGLFVFLLAGKLLADPGDTIMVRTIRFDTNLRSGVFQFPGNPGQQWEKILMLYKMRCKNGLVSTSQNTNQGCGEWDYNCYTYVIDSSLKDSLRTKQKSPVISGFSGNTYPYTLNPVSSYYLSYQQAVTYDSLISEDSVKVGSGLTGFTAHCTPGNSPVRTQFLFTAAELASAGLTADNITGLRFIMMDAQATVKNLSIRIKNSSLSLLNPALPEVDGFEEVYYLTTPFVAAGPLTPISFNFYRSFDWDGISNIVVEFCADQSWPVSGALNTMQGELTGPGFAICSQGRDSYISFSGSIQFIRVNPAVYGNISDQVTVAFWAYGDTLKLPANTSILEGVDSANRRTINVHLPWSNSRVYWDCGNSGGTYDRIDQAASPQDFEGRWNFWTFTKNTGTGIMNIYLNGHLFQTGSGKVLPIDIHRLIIGKSADYSLSYYGHMDELSFWNKALDSAAIALIMNNSINPSHPDYSHLLAYYRFDNDTGSVCTDSGPGQLHSTFINPSHRLLKGSERFRDFADYGGRPNTTFVKGIYNSSVQSFPAIDTIENTPVSALFYQVISNNLSVLDTMFIWKAGYTYIYDTTGQVSDSIFVNADDTLNVTDLIYYRRRPMYFELINFITPYGINLNMNGLTGKTWIFDVTDYAPFLRGKKLLAMGDGIYQEDNEITFVFYEGIPPRDVLAIQQVWPNGTWVSPGYNSIYNDDYFEARNVQLRADASQFRMRTAISGHGQEGEFIPRQHTVRVNDSVSFTTQVWKECADNPIYPQGGTWIFDRAGWCPGAAVDLREYEITQYVTPGQSCTIDYSLPYLINPGSSNYRVNHQLVSYGPPNFSLDARLETIIRPSKSTEASRRNPLCSDPVITIRNTGSIPLQSLRITYGRKGAAMSTHTWTGNLPFLASQQITLPMPDWAGSQVNTFVAWVSEPNGGQDQYPYNDSLESDFEVPPVLPADLVFVLKTNYTGYQNEYTLTDYGGDTVIHRFGLANDSIYNDTVHLEPGCYTLYLTDTEQNGLHFWYHASQGSGYMRIKGDTLGIIHKSFNPDFGKDIYYEFTVGYYLSEDDIPLKENFKLRLMPNPAADFCILEFSLPMHQKTEIRLLNMLGETVKQDSLVVTNETERFVLDLEDITNGFYVVSVTAGGKTNSRKLVVNR